MVTCKPNKFSLKLVLVGVYSSKESTWAASISFLPYLIHPTVSPHPHKAKSNSVHYTHNEDMKVRRRLEKKSSRKGAKGMREEDGVEEDFN